MTGQGEPVHDQKIHAEMVQTTRPKDDQIGQIPLSVVGGVEKNIVYLANDMAGRGLEVCLATFDKDPAESFFDIDKRVKWYRLGTPAPHRRIGFIDRLKLIARIRRTLVGHSSRTYVLCFHHGINVGRPY